MEQRRLRLGDNIDDYCPRERRLTTHAIVAMVDDVVKQTRCTTCDAEHVYKGAKVPPRRKAAGEAGVLVGGEARLPRTPSAGETPAQAAPERATSDEASLEPPEQAPPEGAPPETDDEGPFHRRLIRAVLPRAEGQVPVRQMPEFTMRQPGVRHPDLVNGNGRRGKEAGTRPLAAAHFKGGHGRPFSRPGKGGRSGGASHGSHQGQRHGWHGRGAKKRSR